MIRNGEDCLKHGDFMAYAAEARRSMERVRDIHQSLNDVEKSIDNLAILPDIASEIKLMRWVVIVLVGTLCALLVLREVGDRVFKISAPGTTVEVHPK